MDHANRLANTWFTAGCMGGWPAIPLPALKAAACETYDGVARVSPVPHHHPTSHRQEGQILRPLLSSTIQPIQKSVPQDLHG